MYYNFNTFLKFHNNYLNLKYTYKSCLFTNIKKIILDVSK